MEYSKCLAVPKTTIKRCRNYSTGGTCFCTVHSKKKGKNATIQLYNGAFYKFGDDLKDVQNFTPRIFLWQYFNRIINSANGSQKKSLEAKAKLIRCGTEKKVIEALLKTGSFSTCDDILTFFQKKNSKKLKRKSLDGARHFLGVIYYFQRNVETLKNIQTRIHIKLAYVQYVEQITKIQNWFKYRMWLKKLPVKPIEMRKRFIPNIDNIITLQRKMREYIKIKVKHSHRCPYSMEDYWEIPNQYRVVYKYRRGKNYHWRYYNIKWLDADWKSQTNERRYVVEPTIKEEYPEEFVVSIARKTWYLTRKENDYLLDEDETKVDYNIRRDWEDRFRRRSLYCFSLMLLDLCDILDVKIENIIEWRKQHFLLKYHIFYLKVMPALKNIADNTHLYGLVEAMFYHTRDMFRTDLIFPDTDISDVASGDAIYGIVNILLISRDRNIEVFNIIKDIIKKNFQIYLMA